MEQTGNLPQIEHECSVKEIFENNPIQGQDLGYRYSIPSKLLRTKVIESELEPPCEIITELTAVDMRVGGNHLIEAEVQLEISELSIEDVVAVIREIVDARIEAEDGRVEVHEPTEREVELLSEYMHNTDSIDGYSVPREDRIVLKFNEGGQA